MHYKKFYYWCREAVSEIRYIPDMNKVYNELFDHLLDRYEGFLARGLSEDEAVERTLEAMGDPKELAPQLAAIHKPHWAYAMVVTRCIVLALLVTVLVRSAYFLNDQHYLKELWLKHFYDPFSETVAECTSHVQPDIKAYCDGYAFRVERAARWNNRIVVRLEVTNPLPWSLEQSAVYYMQAKDSNDAQYTCHAKGGSKSRYCIYVDSQQVGLTTYYYDLHLYGDTADVRWLELRYDRDGREIFLHIDLEGGA